MDLTLTLILLGLTLAVTLLAGWRGALPPNLHKGPRMMPWRFIMLASAALGFLLMVHVVTLISGRSFPMM